MLAARLLIGALFIYASAYKILDPAAFAASIRNYMIIPPAWTNLVALTLPWIEVGAGLFLIFGIQTRPSALLTTGMLAFFLGIIIYAYSIGLDIDLRVFQLVGRFGRPHRNHHYCPRHSAAPRILSHSCLGSRRFQHCETPRSWGQNAAIEWIRIVVIIENSSAPIPRVHKEGKR